MTPAVLEFQGLQVRAGSQTLLDIPSLRLEAGELVSLLGPNGSGKTTLLHTAALLREVDAGQVALFGRIADRHSAASLRRRISVVFQDPLLFSVDVLDNVAAGPRFHGAPQAEAHRRALEWLHLFGVAHLAHRHARTLSGGEAARVALARAFATRPDLLLLDEPFSALDARSRGEIIPELRERLVQGGTAALLVTHDLAEAFSFAPRLILMEGGKVIADGNAQALTMRPISHRVASLLGAENVISARLVAWEHGYALAELACGQRFLAACEHAVQLADSIEVTVPAGMIRLDSTGSTAPHGYSALAARVTSISPQPGWDLITLDTPGATLKARQTWEPAGSRWQAGDMVLASFPPEAAWIIPDAARA